MPTIQLAEQTISYSATITHVPLRLLSRPRAAAAGLYNALATLHIDPAAVTVQHGAPGSLDSDVVARLSGHETYEIGHNQVHWEAEDPDLSDYDALVRPLVLADAWIREEQQTGMQDHRLEYSAHYRVVDAGPEEVLAGLGAPTLPQLGTPHGTGLIYRAVDRRGWNVELTIDRSLVYDGGLFVELALETDDDPVDHAKMVVALFDLYDRTLPVLRLSVAE